ncbi:MAG: NAD(P)-binding protein, partial [archaeon]
MAKISVAGAGISGMTAAINLAKAGFDVKVFEKAESIGGIPAICALRNYDLNKDAIEELNACGINLKHFGKIKKVVKFSPNESIEEYSSGVIFYVLERGKSENSLESQLYNRALDVGVEFVFGESVPEGNVDIVATGPKRVDIFAYGHIYKNLGFEKNNLHIIYDNLYSPKGYTYIISSGGKCLICTVSFDKKNFKYIPLNFNFLLKKNAGVKKLVGRRNPVKVVRGYGNYGLPRSAKKGGRLYVGESAEFQDASKGFGIRYAILSGYLAAKSIINKEDYDGLWKSEFYG